jgi:hypothetical protein
MAPSATAKAIRIMVKRSGDIPFLFSTFNIPLYDLFNPSAIMGEYYINVSLWFSDLGTAQFED